MSITDTLPSMEDIEESAKALRGFLERWKPANESLAQAFLYLDTLDKEIKDADSALDEAESAIEEMEDSIEKDKALALFADHHNWNGTEFRPVMYIDRSDEPWTIADKALR